jgi:hypothetical protein
VVESPPAQTPLSGHKNRNAPLRMQTASRASMTFVILEIYHARNLS